MWLMRVVSNTSPLSNLAIIGRLDLLQPQPMNAVGNGFLLSFHPGQHHREDEFYES